MEKVIDYILKKYPSGVMNGRRVVDMPVSQLCAIYNNLITREMLKPKGKQVPGQTSLFE